MRKMMKKTLANTQEFLLKNGFYIVIALLVTYYSLAAPHFLTFRNFNGLFHAAAPLLVIAGGMALVVLTGKLDISLGSIAYLSCCMGVMMYQWYNASPIVCFFVIIATGAICGAINGFIVVVLRVNPLITTLGTLMAFRGVGLVISQSYEVGLPDQIRELGNAYFGPVFLDVVIGIVVLLALFLVQSRTVFGRHIMALGNNVENSARLGIQVNKITFFTFVSAGLIASLGGILSLVQNGRFTFFLGQGYEFTAVAAVVLGGISLFGGEGKIFPGVLVGVFTLELIRNGLNHVGANPYLYGFVNGGIIFLAMSIDALKTRSRGRIRVIEDEAELGKKIPERNKT